MFELICYISDAVKEVVKSNNQRDFDISHDNNQTKIELSKVVLGGMTLLGTLACNFIALLKTTPKTNSRKTEGRIFL